MANNNGIRLGVLIDTMVDPREIGHVTYWLCEELGYEDINQIIKEEDLPKLKQDIKKAMKMEADSAAAYDDEEFEDDDEVSFYCSNERGEGRVDFTKDGSYWHEHWSEWEGYDDDDDGAPDSMRYESYLSKSDLKNWLYHDGFTNITEVE